MVQQFAACVRLLNFFDLAMQLTNGPAPGPIHEVLSLMAAASAMPVSSLRMAIS